MSHGLRMPSRDVVRSESAPETGLAMKAKNAPTPVTIDRLATLAGSLGESSATLRASVLMTGVMRAMYTAKYAAT